MSIATSEDKVTGKLAEGIVEQDGAIVLNGIKIFIGERSYFGHMEELLPVMHFEEGDWGPLNDGEPYPEVWAIWTRKPDEFCLPPGAKWEMEGNSRTGEILCRIYAKEMPGSPVMECGFPNPNILGVENIYRVAMRGL
jgi:hypothetical protein